MDFSSLTEAQQQQMQQLQTQYQEHQAQQQQAQAESISSAAAAQQYQDYASQQQQQQQAQASYDSQSQAQYSYDPSQAQSSYDPSSSYYSSYYHQYQDPQQPQSYQHAPQYASYSNGGTNVDYSNAYQQQQQQYSHTAPYYQPAVPVSRERPPPQAQATDQRLGEGTQHQQNAYNPPHDNNSNASSFNNQVGSVSVPGGLNAAAAAAVAALSQLTRYAGNMEAVERAQGGRQWYDNGGGGYGQPMDPGHFMGHMGPPVGWSPHRGGGRRGGFRGGRGNFGNHPPNTGGYGPHFRGRGRGRGRSGQHYQPPGAPSSLVEASAAEGEEPAAANNNEAQAHVRNQKSIRIAWCELCRVDCTSLEILEQHKNGKRHKKSLQRLDEVKSSSEASAVLQVHEKITSDTGAEVPENAQRDGQKPENVPTDVGIDENKVENELDDDEEKNQWRQGLKRKMRGGRGAGKRVKTFGGPSRRALGPPKPKVVIPLICDLCNVKCDTQEVFDRHVAGKKHMAKLKRFEGHQAMYGPTGVQALYPPNPIAQTLFRPQGPQQASDAPPHGSYPPPGDCIPPQAQNPNPQLSDAPLEFGNQNNVPESVAVEPETKQVTT